MSSISRARGKGFAYVQALLPSIPMRALAMPGQVIVPNRSCALVLAAGSQILLQLLACHDMSSLAMSPSSDRKVAVNCHLVAVT